MPAMIVMRIVEPDGTDAYAIFAEPWDSDEPVTVLESAADADASVKDVAQRAFNEGQAPYVGVRLSTGQVGAMVHRSQVSDPQIQRDVEADIAAATARAERFARSTGGGPEAVTPEQRMLALPPFLRRRGPMLNPGFGKALNPGGRTWH